MKTNTKKLVTTAVIGALYAALTMVLAPISYGPVQFRVSEVLTILPFFMPYTTWGLFLGCIIANLASSAGIFDIVFGSLATLIACLCTAQFGKKEHTLINKLLALFMPVIWNAVIVGAMLAIVIAGVNPYENFPEFLTTFAIFGGEVGLGEIGVLYIFGLPLMTYLPKQKFFADFVQSMQ